MKLGFLIILNLSWFPVYSQLVTGKIVDADTKNPIGYVNIGVVGGYKGTVCDNDGSFSLNLSQQNDFDTLRISIIGYYPISFTVGDFKKIFQQNLSQHFPSVDNNELMKGWSAASMIFPWITRFVWGDIDLKWFPEANLSHPSHKGFYTVKDYIERVPMEGSNIDGILPWALKKLSVAKTELISPLQVADTLELLSNISLASLKKMPKIVHASADELNQTLSDIEGFANIGKYYAEKIRAACDLALFDTTRNEAYRNSAVQHLRSAKQYWDKYAAIYSIKNKPALYNRVGYVDVIKLKEKVQQDIDMVINWKPGANKLNMSGNTEKPFKE